MRCLTTSVGTRTIEAARPAPRPPDKAARNCLFCGTRFSTCCLMGSYTPMKMADAGRTPVMHIRGLADQSLHAGALNIADHGDRAHRMTTTHCALQCHGVKFLTQESSSHHQPGCPIGHCTAPYYHRPSTEPSWTSQKWQSAAWSLWCQADIGLHRIRIHIRICAVLAGRRMARMSG